MAGDGYDRFFALRSSRPCSFGQNSQTFLNRRIIGLEAHHAPGTFHQRRAQPRITVFGHTAWHSLAPAAVFAWTQSRVGTDRAPIGKTSPRADLACHYHRGQLPTPAGTLAGAVAS